MQLWVSIIQNAMSDGAEVMTVPVGSLRLGGVYLSVVEGKRVLEGDSCGLGVVKIYQIEYAMEESSVAESNL